jgi:hypothetical protein
MNYLEKATRPDIAYAVHQCAKFSAEPKRQHGEAIRWIARYLKGTRDKGIILTPDADKQLEVYVDADFACNWDPEETDHKDTARSRHGYFICYAGFPIFLEITIALSSTESEITGLLYSLRDAIPIMNLLGEIMTMRLPVGTEPQRQQYTAESLKTTPVEIAKVPKCRPRTKHFNNHLHHFRSYVDIGQISIHKIDTLRQPAGILTKPLGTESFNNFRRMIMGW